MRTAFLTTALLVGFAAPTLAQSPPPGPPGMNMRGGGPGEGGAGPMNFMKGEQMGGMMLAARELASGAFFRFKRGDDEVDIHCPSNMAVQACVGAATDLMSTLQRTGSGGGQGGGQSGKGSSQQ